MLQNTMKIDLIKYEDKLKCFCPLGNDYYHNQLTIEFVPNEVIPDYIKLHNDIQALTNEVLTIEDAVVKVLDIVKEYDPLFIHVYSYVYDAPHPTVTVTKAYAKHTGGIVHGQKEE